MKIGAFLGVLLFLSAGSWAQQGGSATYAFLDLDNSARVAATGGSILAVKDGDVNLAFRNPSLLDSSMHGALALNYMGYFAGVKYMAAGYVHQFGEFTTSAHLMYLNYGQFQRADQFGNLDGTFTANDMVLSFGVSKKIDTVFSLGGNLKLINSILESYSSFGAAVDITGTYHNKAKGFTASAIIKNAGVQFKGYYTDNNERLPISICAGFSKKAAKAPFRLHVLYCDLQKWDLTYADPNARTEVDLNGDEIPIKPPGLLEKFMRHMSFGLEFVPSDAFFVDFGFNYRRMKELRLDNRPGLVGFSVGGGIKIKRFMLSYGRASYHRAGGSNSLTITTRIKGA